MGNIQEVSVAVKLVNEGAEDSSIAATIVRTSDDNFMIEVDQQECIIAEISFQREYPKDRRVIKVLANTVSSARFQIDTAYLVIEPIEENALTKLFGPQVS